MISEQASQSISGYVFVMNVGALTDAESYTLTPGHELRRARHEEIAFVKTILKQRGFTDHEFGLWEQRLPRSANALAGILEALLPEHEWRYFVIAFNELDATTAALEGMFDLSHLELEVGFTVLSGSSAPGVISFRARLFHVLENARNDNSFFLNVAASDIEEMRSTHALLHREDPRLDNIRGLVRQLTALKGLPHDSTLRFLGYFAILESLLTHAPKPSDPYDSITRQVKKKLALLDNRFPVK